MHSWIIQCSASFSCW